MQNASPVVAAFVGAFSLMMGAAEVAAKDDYAVHTFKCPPNVTVKFNWVNKIQANPDFPLLGSYENLTHSASFRESGVNKYGENTVGCLYVIPQTVFQAPYVYKVHRKILSCTGQPGPNITCNLKKD